MLIFLLLNVVTLRICKAKTRKYIINKLFTVFQLGVNEGKNQERTNYLTWIVLQKKLNCKDLTILTYQRFG